MTETVLSWSSFGVSSTWIDDVFTPACEALDEWLIPDDLIADFDDLTCAEVNFDVLLMGRDGESPPPGKSFEWMIEAVVDAHPLGCVLAVVHESTPELEASLMRAGAADVISTGLAPGQLREAVERCSRKNQHRRHRFEEEKLRVVSQLAVSVNHEINNPLTGLLGTTELIMLENENSLGDKMRQDLQTIVAQCGRIREITTRLRSLNDLRTVNYGAHDQMLDLVGPIKPLTPHPSAAEEDMMFPAPRLLIVDDNPLIVELVNRLFDKQYVFDAAGGAADALTMAVEHDYDMILIDLILPEMNGLELFRAIRELKPDQKAMLTTAHTGDVRVSEAIAEGALGCINKPFKLEELSEALERALHKN